jgi:Peptide methionine sulfoxide reductase/Protein of unknown function, DUF417
MPHGWDPAAGFPAMAGNVRFLMKDVVLLAVSIYLLKQDVVRMSLSNRNSEMISKRQRADDMAALVPTLSFREILEFFFQIHDPSTLNRQGNDVGMSYRSAIFFTNDEQKRIAIDTIADVNASGLWPGKATTEVVPAGDFWQAEPEHQDYLERLPNGYTCHFVRPDWKLPRRKAG